MATNAACSITVTSEKKLKKKRNSIIAIRVISCSQANLGISLFLNLRFIMFELLGGISNIIKKKKEKKNLRLQNERMKKKEKGR